MGNKRTDTLGDLVRFHVSLLVRCEACGHEKMFGPAELLGYGAGVLWRSLKFRCSACRSRQVKAGIRPADMR